MLAAMPSPPAWSKAGDGAGTWRGPCLLHDLLILRDASSIFVDLPALRQLQGP